MYRNTPSPLFSCHFYFIWTKIEVIRYAVCPQSNLSVLWIVQENVFQMHSCNSSRSGKANIFQIKDILTKLDCVKLFIAYFFVLLNYFQTIRTYYSDTWEFIRSSVYQVIYILFIHLFINVCERVRYSVYVVLCRCGHSLLVIQTNKSHVTNSGRCCRTITWNVLDYCSSDHWPCWTTDTPHQTIFVGLLTLWTIGWNSHPFKYSRVHRVFIDFWKYVCREYEMTSWNSYTRLSCTFVLGSCSKELTPETEWQKEPRIKESSENRCHGISPATSDDDVNVWDSETLGNREGKYARERGETLCMSTCTCMVLTCVEQTAFAPKTVERCFCLYSEI